MRPRSAASRSSARNRRAASTRNRLRNGSIRRERKAMKERGIVIETLREDALVPSLVTDVFELYAATVDKFFYGRRYLNRAFKRVDARCSVRV